MAPSELARRKHGGIYRPPPSSDGAVIRQNRLDHTVMTTVNSMQLPHSVDCLQPTRGILLTCRPMERRGAFLGSQGWAADLGAYI